MKRSLFLISLILALRAEASPTNNPTAQTTAVTVSNATGGLVKGSTNFFNANLPLLFNGGTNAGLASQAQLAAFGTSFTNALAAQGTAITNAQAAQGTAVTNFVTAQGTSITNAQTAQGTAITNYANLRQAGSTILTNWSAHPTNDYAATNILTTKGDLYVMDGTNLTRLPTGTNGQMLFVNVASATGYSWSNAPAGGGGSTSTNDFVATSAGYLTNGTLFTGLRETNTTHFTNNITLPLSGIYKEPFWAAGSNYWRLEVDRFQYALKDASGNVFFSITHASGDAQFGNILAANLYGPAEIGEIGGEVGYIYSKTNFVNLGVFGDGTAGSGAQWVGGDYSYTAELLGGGYGLKFKSDNAEFFMLNDNAGSGLQNMEMLAPLLVKYPTATNGAVNISYLNDHTGSFLSGTVYTNTVDGPDTADVEVGSLANGVYLVKVKAVGNSAGNDSHYGGYERTFTLVVQSATASILGSVQDTYTAETDSVWDVTCAAGGGDGTGFTVTVTQHNEDAGVNWTVSYTLLKADNIP